MNLSKTVLEVCGLEVDHEAIPAGKNDLTAVGKVSAALRWCRNVAEKYK